MNPLLATEGLPEFAAVRPEHIAPAMAELLAAAAAALERVVGDDVPAEHQAVSAIIDVAVERLERAWDAVAHLNAVVDTKELRAAYTGMLPQVTAFRARLAADERLYAKYKAIATSAGAARLGVAERKGLANAIRDFVLSGAELQGAAKARFKQIQERKAELSQKFAEHVLDATAAGAFYVDEAELPDVPVDVLAAARAAAEADGRSGCKVTLQVPCYLPLMQYCSNRALRERLWTAYVTRASELGAAEHDNSAVMRELLRLRQEEARLLGYRNYAELSLATKMAESPAEVLAFLRDLAARARPSAERDLAELRDFARQELGLADLQVHDLLYASEKLQQHRYSFSEQEVRQYFPLPKVLDGLFRIVETVFEVEISPDQAPVWHDDARFFKIERVADGVRRLVGQFYLDPFARTGKRSGAWMDDVHCRWLRPGGKLQTPVATLVCNFAAPVGGRPALLRHDDVRTLFHEFGHGLHHMLTQVDDLAVSGINGVEWDAVELPSQFMENFGWEWDVLQALTAHVDTDASLPRALYERMLAAKNFQSGMQMLRQVEYAWIDMRLHAEPGSDARIAAIVDEVRREVAVLLPPPCNRFLHAFSHVFSGGYAAGYYSYKWAEVLSADAWSAFEEATANGPAAQREVSRRYREQVLEMGGSRSAMENFKAFRGRAPRIDALLRHQGLAG